MKGLIREREIGLSTDLYELTMAQIYFNKKMEKEAVFDFYIRPSHKRRYYLFYGLYTLLQRVCSFGFLDEEIEYLRSLGKFSEDFLSYLKGFRFTGDIWSVDEGEIVFANEPLVSVKASLIEAQIIETVLINTLQLPIMVASKASRCVQVAQKTKLVDFGLRRAQGLEAGLIGARSAYIAGFLGTSNLLAAKRYGIPVFGTMAHSYILAHKSEEDAFKDFIITYPENTILLVDTFDTIEGVKKAIKTVQSMKKSFKGIRLDSGDIVSLSKEARVLLDEAGYKDAMIFVSGGLNEYKIKDILAQKAPVDGWGVGTELLVSADMSYLDCAYKLAAYDGQPKMKLSPHKTTLPSFKQIFRIYDQGVFQKDRVGLYDEDLEGEKLLKKVMQKGEICIDFLSLDEIKQKVEKKRALLPPSFFEIEEAEPYTPTISSALQKVINSFKIR